MFNKSKKLILVGSIFAVAAVTTVITVPILLLKHSKVDEDDVDLDALLIQKVALIYSEMGIKNPDETITSKNSDSHSSQRIIELSYGKTDFNVILEIIGSEFLLNDELNSLVRVLEVSSLEDDESKVVVSAEVKVASGSMNKNVSLSFTFGNFISHNQYKLNNVTSLISEYYTSQNKDSILPSEINDGEVTLEMIGLQEKTFDFSVFGVSSKISKTGHNNEGGNILINLTLEIGDLSRVISNIEVRGFKSSLEDNAKVTKVKLDYFAKVGNAQGYDSETSSEILDQQLGRYEVDTLDHLSLINFPLNELLSIDLLGVNVSFEFKNDETHIEGKTYTLECKFTLNGYEEFFSIKINSSNLIIENNQEKVVAQKEKIEGIIADAKLSHDDENKINKQQFHVIPSFLASARWLSTQPSKVVVSQKMIADLEMYYLSLDEEFNYSAVVDSKMVGRNSNLIVDLYISMKHSTPVVLKIEYTYPDDSIWSAVYYIKDELNLFTYGKIDTKIYDNYTTGDYFEKLSEEIIKNLKFYNIPTFPLLEYTYILNLFEHTNDLEDTYKLTIKGVFTNARGHNWIQWSGDIKTSS